MTPALLDDAAAMTATGTLAGRYAAGFASEGTPRLVANVESLMRLAQLGPHCLPVTVDAGRIGSSYVANPHSAYVLYAREEMDIVGLRRGRVLAQGAVALADRVLRAAAVQRIVHIDNWLLSTNLHGAWEGQGLPALRALLAEAYPGSLLALRSLDARSSPALLRAAVADGWVLLPARQVYLVADPARDWLPRRDTRNDRRALARSGLMVEVPAVLSGADCARIADLYRQLYLEKYSHLNPDFTPDFIAMTHRIGALHYRLARDGDGRILAVSGMLARGGFATSPIVGYDRSRPQREALYRIAAYLFAEWGWQRGLALHASAGVADFKRQRGATAEIEYMAVYTRHLSRPRRLAVAALAALLQRAAVPLMQRMGW